MQRLVLAQHQADLPRQARHQRLHDQVRCRVAAEHSHARHHAAAQATGKPCVLLSLPGIALDVDNPSDLHALAAASGETHAQRLVRQWQLDDLPQAANE